MASAARAAKVAAAKLRIAEIDDKIEPLTAKLFTAKNNVERAKITADLARLRAERAKWNRIVRPRRS